jgi:hypothetical protein
MAGAAGGQRNRRRDKDSRAGQRLHLTKGTTPSAEPSHDDALTCPFGLSGTFPDVSELAAAAGWSGAGEGEHRWFLGTLATIKVAGEASDGRFALIEFLFPRHTSPPVHTHRPSSTT